MAKPIYKQRIDLISQNYTVGQFKAASEDLGLFMNEREGFNDGFYTIPDPHVVGFKVFFHFDEPDGIIADGSSSESAIAYLNRIGETKRAQMLISFRNLLSVISSKYPHTFVSVEGIMEAFTAARTDLEKEDMILNINCLSTLDNKVQALMHLWRNIIWDDIRKVWVLPRDLRQFTMSVYLFEASFYHTEINFLPTFENQDLYRINHQLFEFHHCEFTNESGSAYFGTIDKSAQEQAVTNLNIKFKESNISGLFRNLTGDTAINLHTAAISTIAIVEELNLNRINVDSGRAFNTGEQEEQTTLEPVSDSTTIVNGNVQTNG